MSKSIVVESKSCPDDHGYQDKIVVFDDNKVAFHSACSACPNPFQHSTKKHWREVYGWVSCEEYSFEAIESEKRGKCILINSGLAIPARYPNPNHNGLEIVTEVFIHKGWSDSWRGSAGCITIPPTDWPEFINCFELGEEGELAIVDFSKMKETHGYAAKEL
jgi:hypothetical protein